MNESTRGGMLPLEKRRPLDNLPPVEAFPDDMTVGELRSLIAERCPGALHQPWRGDIVGLADWLARQITRLPACAKSEGRHVRQQFVLRATPDAAAALRELIGVLLLPIDTNEGE